MGDDQANLSSNQIKKNVGKLVLKVNGDILELQKEFGKEASALSVRATRIKTEIEKNEEVLIKILENLEERSEFVQEKNLKKTVNMIRMNIDTIKKVLGGEGVTCEKVSEDIIEGSNQEATEIIDEVNDCEKKAGKMMDALMAEISENGDKEDTESNDDEEKMDEAVKNELKGIDKYKSDRVKKMKREIERKMSYHKDDLLQKWKSQKEMLDYQALKEFRNDFEMTHRSLRNMVNEFDRRKISDVLTDYLMDIIDNHFDGYMVEFRRMDEEKRMEAALIRKRNLEIEEYRKEKRRNIPTWPKSMTYTKFKPDLLSWDKEHHLTSGSVKFGLLAEMLKSQDRVTTYEQIQTRLGKERNDDDIIKKVTILLDGINEETVYNKLASAWEDILLIQKKKEENLNEFFSRFETLLYSLNLADEKYEELEPVKENMSLSTTILKEKKC